MDELHCAALSHVDLSQRERERERERERKRERERERESERAREREKENRERERELYRCGPLADRLRTAGSVSGQDLRRGSHFVHACEGSALYRHTCGSRLLLQHSHPTSTLRQLTDVGSSIVYQLVNHATIIHAVSSHLSHAHVYPSVGYIMVYRISRTDTIVS